MKVHFFATYRQVVGDKEIDVEAVPGLTVQALAGELLKRYPALRHEWLDEQGNLLAHIHFFVNGREAKFLPDGMQAALGESDVVKIFPPIGGG